MASAGQRTGQFQVWSPQGGRAWTVRCARTMRVLFEGTFEQAWNYYENPPAGALVDLAA